MKVTFLPLFIIAITNYGLYVHPTAEVICGRENLRQKERAVQITLTKRIHKRDIRQMCNLIKEHITNVNCLDFVDYGCFCGYGWTEGARPLDPVDNCCLQHDICYMDVNCWFPFPLIYPYGYICKDGLCSCTDSRSFWRVCRRDLCECDLQLARCLGETEHLFNRTYIDYDYQLCEINQVIS